MIVVWYYLVSHLLAAPLSAVSMAFLSLVQRKSVATQPRSMLPPPPQRWKMEGDLSILGRHLGVDAVTAMKLQTDSYELTINNQILWCGAKKWFVFFFISMLDGVDNSSYFFISMFDGCSMEQIIAGRGDFYNSRCHQRQKQVILWKKVK